MLGSGKLTAADFPTPGAVVNIVEWDGGNLSPVYERSDQLPLSKQDVLKLLSSGFNSETIERMVQQRRYAGDASAEGLIGLKEAGFDEKVLSAVSLHALSPNRSIHLTVQLSFEGDSSQARRRYLYVIIPDGKVDRIFTADLGAVLANRWQRDEAIDRTDLLLSKRVRRITFSSRVPLKVPGAKRMIVITPTRPDIHADDELSDADRASAKVFEFDYPSSSIIQDCRVHIRYRRDVLLPHQWDMVGAYFETEWE